MLVFRGNLPVIRSFGLVFRLRLRIFWLLFIYVNGMVIVLSHVSFIFIFKEGFVIFFNDIIEINFLWGMNPTFCNILTFFAWSFGSGLPLWFKVLYLLQVLLCCLLIEILWINILAFQVILGLCLHHFSVLNLHLCEYMIMAWFPIFQVHILSYSSNKCFI